MVYIVFDNSCKNEYVDGWDKPTISYISFDKQKCCEYIKNKKEKYLSANPDGKVDIDTESAFAIDCGKWYYEYEKDIL